MISEMYCGSTLAYLSAKEALFLALFTRAPQLKIVPGRIIGIQYAYTKLVKTDIRFDPGHLHCRDVMAEKSTWTATEASRLFAL